MIERESQLLHLAKVILDGYIYRLSICRLGGIVQAKLLSLGDSGLRLECCSFIQPQHPPTLALEVAKGIAGPRKATISLEGAAYLGSFAPTDVFLDGHRLQRRAISLLHLWLAVTSWEAKAHNGK